jgi:hypothetical protein
VTAILVLGRARPAAADTISDPCAPPIRINVVRTACRFGTATARVTVTAGTQTTWTLTGGALLSSETAPTVSLGFGGADHADLSVTLSGRGCTASDTVRIDLREPLDVATLDVFPSVPFQDEPAVIAWSYRGSDPARTQRLTVGGRAVLLDAATRSYAFTPTIAGPLAVTLDASSIVISGRRRAVGVGDPAPPASACSATHREITATIAPRCTHPTARVTGGGSACDAVTVIATFTGTPPFTGRWSDGLTFSTSATQLARSVRQSGIYTLAEFADAECAGETSGSAVVTIIGAPSSTLAMTPTAAVSVAPGDTGTLTLGFANASSCTLASALGNSFPAYACSGTGSLSLAYPKDRDRAGDEKVSLHVTGPCGSADASTQFFICDYIAFFHTTQPITFCAGGSVTFTIDPGGTSAGSPYGTYKVYRCPAVPPAVCNASDFTLVLSSASNTYTATMQGTYIATMTDRLGCPSRFGAGGVVVRVNACPP